VSGTVNEPHEYILCHVFHHWYSSLGDWRPS